MIPPGSDHADRHDLQLPVLLLELLRISAGAEGEDVATWRQYVLTVCGRYDEPRIARGFQELTDRGFITRRGSPRCGWLTPIGKRALAESGPALARPEVVVRTFAPPAAPRLTFREHDRRSRREYWHKLLRETHGNIRQAAILAKCPRTTVHQQLQQLDVRARDFK